MMFGIMAAFTPMILFLNYSLFTVKTQMNNMENLEAHLKSSTTAEDKAESKFIPEDLAAWSSEVMDDLEVPDKARRRLRLFVADHLEPAVIGSLCGRIGAAVGFPVFFQWRNKDDVDLRKLKRYKNRYDMSDPGQRLTFKKDIDDLEELKEALCVSKEEVKFILAVCLMDTFTYQPTKNALLSIAPCALSPFVAHRMYHTVTLVKKAPSFVRYTIYAMIASFHAIVALAGADAFMREYELGWAGDIRGLGPEYREAGRKYYERAEKRGKLLRSALRNGEEYFDESGTPIGRWFEVYKRKSLRDYKELYVGDGNIPSLKSWIFSR